MLPKDPIILLSYVNMKLRDNYSSLERLCEDLDVDQQALCETLGAVNYTYQPERNQFV